MGNSNPSTQQNVEQFEHPRLGNVKLYGQPNSQTLHMQYKVTVNNQRELENWLQQKKLIQNAETNEVLFLASKHTFEKQGICGSAGIVKLQYEDYLFLLDSQIKNRRQIDRPFLQTQMWYLIYNILRAGKQYQKYNKKIGDVQPYNVVINQNGQIKIISTESWPQQITNYQKIVQSLNNKVYLAPQQCNPIAIKKGEYPKGVNQLQAEVFSIGLTLLEAATLDDCSVLYSSTPQFSFNYDKLKRIQDNLKNKYGEYLVRLINQMLQINPSQRPTCSELHSILSPYEDNILDLNEFVFDPSISEKQYKNLVKNFPKNRKSQWNINKFFGNNTSSQQQFSVNYGQVPVQQQYINNLNNIQQNPPVSFYGNSSLNQGSGKFNNMVPSSFNVSNSHFSQGQNQFR